MMPDGLASAHVFVSKFQMFGNVCLCACSSDDGFPMQHHVLVSADIHREVPSFFDYFSFVSKVKSRARRWQACSE
jgi:hypothetical protein